MVGPGARSLPGAGHGPAPRRIFRTEISQDGAEFAPHIAGCFLAVDELERIVFTDALVAGWRPADSAFMTAVITMRDHPDGTEYIATAMHRNIADRNRHEQLGFHDGWGTVIRQLADLVESPPPQNLVPTRAPRVRHKGRAGMKDCRDTRWPGDQRWNQPCVSQRRQNRPRLS